jgi:CubicO group peptidase (beta-lactamase class C family)
MSGMSEVWEEWTWCMERMRSDDGIPGIALAMIENRTRPHIKCFGVRDSRTKQPVTPRTVFHIASTQKSMTAMYIATLVDEGRFTWDTPASEIAPQFRLADDDATGRVTIRHLLGMSSGIPGAAQDDFDRHAQHAEDLFEYMPKVRPVSTPGNKFDYSNLSCAAAGFCGAIADGAAWGRLETDFAQAMKTRLFDPIDMRLATFSADEARATGDFAVSHKKAMLWGTSVDDEVVSHPDPLSPAGGLRASITDMARYLATQLNFGVTPEGQRIVSEKNLRETWRPQTRDPNGGGYAMGWGVEPEDGMNVIFHEGNFAGYLALLAMIPERGTGIAMLANMDNDDGFAGAALSEWIPLLDDIDTDSRDNW